MSSQIQEICAEAIDLIAPDVEEGLIGTRHVGLHIAIFSASQRKLIYERNFGARFSRGHAEYRAIAHDKADLVIEHRRALSELMAEGELSDVHNGGFIEGDIVVAVGGAGHLGNVIYGRQVLRHLVKSLPNSEALAA